MFSGFFYCKCISQEQYELNTNLSLGGHTMMRKTVTGLVTLIVLSLLLAPVVFAKPNMQDGMWEIKGEMKLVGLPFPMPPVPVEYTQCLTKKDMVPQQKGNNQDCKMISNKVTGNTVTWVMKCTAKNGVTDSTGKITYKGNSFAGTVRNVTKDNEGTKMESSMKMSGKRIGDCK
jgi:hypothetical protein